MKHVDVAIAVVARGADVLICRRPEGVPFAGYWEFPGGKLEPGETLAQCVVRELAEEVGATVAPESALPTIEHAYPHARVRLHPFVCRLVDGDPRPIGCSETRWVRATALRDYTFPPANVSLLDNVLAHLSPAASDVSTPSPG